MGKLIILGLAVFALAGAAWPPTFAKKNCCAPKMVAEVEVATCKPTGTCNACTNCKYCKHCSEKGGSCSVCRKKATRSN